MRNTRVRPVVACAVMALAMGGTWLGCQPDHSGKDFDSTSAALNGQGKIVQAKQKIPGEYIVLLKGGGDIKKGKGASAQAIHATTDSLLNRHGGTKKFVFSHAVQGFSAKMTETAAAALAADPDIALVEENGEVYAVGVQNNATWGLDRVDQRDLPLNDSYNNRGLTGAGVTVYVIDSGIRTSHSEFEGRASVGADFVDDGLNGQDALGHGTHVAGTIAGKTYGVAKQANVVSVRVIRGGFGGRLDALVAGIDWVTGNHIGPAVANISMGGGTSTILDTAVRNSISAGIVYAISAGNNATDTLGSPARVSEALIVGAITSTDARWVGSSYSASNFGAGLDLFAPGADVLSAGIDGDYATATYTGTSMAAPHVAGLAALYRQAHSTGSAQAIHDLVVGSATVGKVVDPGAGSPNRVAYIAHDSSTLFADNFESGSATQWTVHNGTWAVVTDGTKVYQTTNLSGYARASAGLASWTDQIVEARLKPVTWNGTDRFALLAARFIDTNNYYYVTLRSSGNIELKRLQNGNPTTLDSKSFAINTGTFYKVRLEVVGTSLKAYINDTLELSGSDTTFTAGKIALGTYSGKVSFDDVIVSLGGPSTSSASNPYPSSGATGANPHAILTWMPGDLAISHDVYFGTASPPPAVGNQALNSYAPGTLQNNTTYYWRIDERSATGNLSPGVVWSFTTGSAPGSASAPTPASGSTSIPLAPMLAWMPGSGATAHNVYLGTTSSPGFFGTFTSPVLNLADYGDLDHLTTYYWRVDEVNGTFTTEGPVWSFTTGNPDNRPGFASNPSPANMASNIGTTPTLTWTAGTNAVTHEVTLVDPFGMEKLVSIQPGTSLTLPPLIADAFYAWQVDERNAQGDLTTGRWWTFRTGRPAGAPGKPVNLTPEDFTFGVGLNTTLTWTAASNAESYEVFVMGEEFWDEGEPAIYVTTGTSFTLPPLHPEWEYLWCVTAKNSVAATRGQCSLFFTLSDPATPPPTGPATNPSPISGATGVSTMPTLAFSLPSNASSGAVFFGTSPTSLGYRGHWLGSYLPDELQPDMTYYWRVDAYNKGGLWKGTVWSFTTGPRVLPQPPSNPVPTDGAAGVDTQNATISWTTGSNTFAHRIFFGTTADPPEVAFQEAEYNFRGLGTLLPFTTYYWKVSEVNSAGEAPGALWTFTTGAAPPAAPTMLSPAHGSIDISLTPTLTWAPAAGATSYEVRLGLYNTGEATTFPVGAATSFTVPTALLPGRDYTWDVTAIGSGGSTWSGNWWVFTTTRPAGMPAVAWNPNPAQWSGGISTHPILSWTSGWDAAVTYDVYLTPEAPATNLICSSASTTCDPGILLSDTAYMWRVDERDALGNVIVGVEWSFNTGSSGDIPGLPTNQLPETWSTFVGTLPTLTWTPGAGAEEHWVFLRAVNSTVPPAGSRVSTQTGTSYMPPSPLEPNTWYAWFIGEKNANGIRRGEEMWFRTGTTLGTAPKPATILLPELNATNVGLTPTLTWTAGEGATSHDVYFGTSFPLPLIGNQPGTSFVPGTLAPYTTYFWRIDERNEAGLREGSLWQFSTGAGVTTLFSDNFEDGNMSGWTVHSGSWSVVTDGSKVLKATNTAGYARTSTGLSSWTDQAISARIKPITPTGSNRFIILCGRFQDTNNYYYVALRSNNTIELKKLVNGNPTTLDSKSFTLSLGTWYDVKLVIDGSILQVYINGILQLDGTDATFAAGKMAVGSYAFTTEFDDITVVQP